MAMLTVNGQAVPPPSRLTAAVFDAAGGVSRHAAGNAGRDVSALKRRLELSWAYMAGGDLAALLAAMNGFFEVVYPEPQTGDARSMTCYCGERTSGVLRMQNGVPLWTDVKMTWTER